MSKHALVTFYYGCKELLKVVKARLCFCPQGFEHVWGRGRPAFHIGKPWSSFQESGAILDVNQALKILEATKSA